MPEASAITKIVLHFGTFIYYFPLCYIPMLTFCKCFTSPLSTVLICSSLSSTHVHTVLLFICIIVALFCLCFTCLFMFRGSGGLVNSVTLFWPIKFCDMATRHFPRLRVKFWTLNAWPRHCSVAVTRLMGCCGYGGSAWPNSTLWTILRIVLQALSLAAELLVAWQWLSSGTKGALGD